MIDFKRPERPVSRVFLHRSWSDHLHHDDISVIREWHLKRGFDDVGYHFLVTFDGKVQRGRSPRAPARSPGRAQPRHHRHLPSGGQDGATTAFTAAQFDALRDLCAATIDAAYGGKVTFHGHQEVANRACPVFDYRRELGLSAEGYLRKPRPRLSGSRTLREPGWQRPGWRGSA